MGSLQNPVGGGPRDPDKSFRVERIEEDKLNKDQKKGGPGEGPTDEKLGVASFLLQTFHRVVDFFLESRSTSKVERDAGDNLLLLKNAFETLKNEDRSQDVQFLNQLSQIWSHALEDAMHFKNDAVAFKFKILFKKIQHYPENQPHSFGYYLAENVKQKWIPFPYMELIQKIHTEHEKNPTSSALTEWTLQLEELVSLLKPE